MADEGQQAVEEVKFLQTLPQGLLRALDLLATFPVEYLETMVENVLSFLRYSTCTFFFLVVVCRFGCEC